MLKLTPSAHGILLVDKPAGITSQGVVKKIKWLTRVKKVGHTGTLDPMATGLLPVCLGEATKFSQFLLDSDKTYEATLSLGAQTDTGDREGQVIHSALVPKLEHSLVVAAMSTLTGPIMQVPPMYAAIKIDGKKLYESAREGITIERAARPITVYELRLLEVIQSESESSIRFSAKVSKGTYIRALGEDLAAELGTLGHLSALRRSRTSCFDVSTAHTLTELEDLSEITLLAPDTGLQHLQYVELEPEQITRLRIGQRLNIHAQLQAIKSEASDQQNVHLAELKSGEQTGKPSDTKSADVEPTEVELIRVGSSEERFAGLCELEADGRLQPKRMMHLGD